MPDRSSRKGSVEDLPPANGRAWARAIWADRDKVAKIPSGAWLLRDAAKELGLDEEIVDEVISRAESSRWRKNRE